MIARPPTIGVARPPAAFGPGARIAPQAIVLIEAPQAGRAGRGLPRAHRALAQAGVPVLERIPLSELPRVQPWIAQPDALRPLIVAAGGDGTVGAVADLVAGTSAVLGILPLGTSNNVARSLHIPLRIEEAAALLATGTVATVDFGRFCVSGMPPHHFVHAAALGLNVTFARLASQVWGRKRWGPFTYLVAAALAFRRRQPFRCTISLDGRPVALTLIHLSVINAPVFGGRFRFRLSASSVDDRLLDVLAIDHLPAWRLLPCAVLLLLGKRLHIGGIRLYHTHHLRIEADSPLEVTLDGEIAGWAPADVVLASEGLQVVVGQRFVDMDEPCAGR